MFDARESEKPNSLKKKSVMIKDTRQNMLETRESEKPDVKHKIKYAQIMQVKKTQR